MKQLGISVTNQGYTVVDPAGKAMNVAIEWKDLGGFEDMLVERLTALPDASSTEGKKTR